MRVSTIRSLKIKNLILPNEVSGSYWIDGTDNNGIKRNLISIEAENGKWKLISNKEVYCSLNGQKIPLSYLENGKFYYIKNDISKETFFLYCSPVYTNYNCYEVDSLLLNGIKVGSNTNNQICFNAIDSEALHIQKIEEKIYVIDNGSKSGIYINDVRVLGKRELFIGDLLFISGLKIILSMNNEGKYCLYINNVDISNIVVNLNAIQGNLVLNSNYEESSQELEFKMYDEHEYFHKTPRFLQKIEELILQIDAPPAKVEQQENPVFLTIGPMLTMSMTSMVIGYSTISNVLSGETSWAKAMPSIVICGVMLASVLIWPIFSKWYEKKTKIKNEKLRQKKYSEYIESKRKTIIEAKNEQSGILKNTYISTAEAADTILKKYNGLWKRRIEDDDYLELNLGIGVCPMKIDIKYPEDHFSMAEDNLKDMVSTLGREPKMLIDVPIVLSLVKTYITGFIGEGDISEYIRKLLIQLLALHSYDDLKIIVLTDEENEYKWDFLKNIPHCLSDDRSIRFFATNNDEYKEISYYLDNIFKSRKEKLNNSDIDMQDLDKTYFILTDSFKRVRNFDIIDNILKSKKYYGFSIAILENKITNLPDQCETFVILNKNNGEIRDNENINETIKFIPDLQSVIDYDKCAMALANIPIELDNNDETQLVNRIGFLEMYDVGKIEQLNSPVRWIKNNPILNLQVPVGIGKNGEKINIDLHEKYHGPHGLIAGMTGSGKSEFIITYILSMAINYHPYEVQFILIDYKGGGLAGAFENKNTGLKLPHLVGTITNLDVNEIKRSLASIESELKRRQTLFNKAREISGESTIDIYKYQKMYRDKIVSEPVSHLFIISDEFAELKNQQPEFMEQLISTARIGRSLGVHLILATQKPSGVVDPQIWSNTRFRVCMRVQDKSDSNEVIKLPDAAYLKQTGRFYFQVGYNELFLLGQAAYAGGKYVPTEKVAKTLNTSIDFIDNIGYSIKKVETKIKNVETNIKAEGEELVNLVRYLNNIATSQNIKCRPLWLDKMSSYINLENLSQKYNYSKRDYFINPIIGEYDIPSQQQQQLLTLPLSEEGNALIYGASGSGKENLITTMIYSTALYHSPQEINYYIVDFGSGALKMFDGYPIVGDILNSEDDEKIKNLFKMINTYIEERKLLFAEYNGNYADYVKSSGKSVPSIVVIINNYESYQETYPDLDDTLAILTRDCEKYGIYFVITVNTPNGMRFKIRQNFSLTYVLQQNSDDDYITILGNIQKNYPAKLFGRGLFKKENTYEFQTAMVCEKENINKYIRNKKEEFISKFNTKSKQIPILPNIVSYKDIISDFGKNDELIIGIDKNTLETCKFDFVKNYITLVSSMDIMFLSKFINPFINQIIANNKSSLIVINAEDINISDKYKSQYEYVNQKFDDVFEKIKNFAYEQKEKYINNGYDKSIFKKEKRLECVIIGIDSFKNRLNDENKVKLGELFSDGKDLGIINYTVIDSIDKIKKYELEQWFKNCVNSNYGIWIGNGINDQFTIKIVQKIDDMRNDITDDFCFVVKRGKVSLVKYVQNLELNIKNSSDDDII